jgi:hypothetical protein
MENNGWTGKPGVPLNPERDGWHWVQEPGQDQECALWRAKPFLGAGRGCWETKGTEDAWEPREVSNWHYLGPCLTPAEVEARIAELEGALREMVYETTHLSPEYDDGSHWCKISKRALEKARAALTGGKNE